jgi:hypothetical protein
VSIPNKRRAEPDQGRSTLRKIAGIVAMIFGIPNLIIGIGMTLSGIGLVVVLVIMGIRLMFEEPSDSLCGPILIVLLIILIVVALIMAVIFTIIAFIFAIGVSGQTIGGYYGLRGLRYNRTIVLTLIGSLVSFLAGIILLATGFSIKDAEQWVRIGAIIWGAYDLLAFVATMASMIMFISTKTTFTEPEKKSKKKNKRRKKTKKSDPAIIEEEIWDS